MRYHAYLLRLWISVHSDTAQWRASLENIHTHERLMFTELEGLIAFLRYLADEEEEDPLPLSTTIEEETP